MTDQITHTGPLWRWTSPTAPAAWFFVTIDGAAGEALSGIALMNRLEGLARGFGSLKVTARIGGSTFKTSVFPSRELGWMIPVKAAVRKAEGLGGGGRGGTDAGGLSAFKPLPLSTPTRHPRAGGDPGLADTGSPPARG